MSIRRLCGAVVLLLLGACSTMDDVDVLHRCAASVSVTVSHLQPLHDPREFGPTEVPPATAARVAGIINMGSEHSITITTAMGWSTTLARAELRAIDGPIELPREACPATD